MTIQMLKGKIHRAKAVSYTHLFYKNDYQEITNYFSDDYVAYEDTIKQMRKLAKMIKEVT